MAISTMFPIIVLAYLSLSQPFKYAMASAKNTAVQATNKKSLI
jgi:hypothetical protein